MTMVIMAMVMIMAMVTMVMGIMERMAMIIVIIMVMKGFDMTQVLELAVSRLQKALFKNTTLMYVVSPQECC